MKTLSLIGMGVISIALSGATALAGQGETNAQTKTAIQTAPRPRVVLVEITGSRIPQQVVVSGEQVNSAAPLRVFQGRELTVSGATSVGHVFALDPDVSFSRPRH